MNQTLTIATILALSAACTVAPTTTGTTTPEPVPADGIAAQDAPPPAAEYPRSGGLTRESAEVLSIGTPVEGVVQMGHELFYSFTATEGTPVKLTFYSEGIWTGRSGMNMYYNVLDAHGGKLTRVSVAVYATNQTSDFDKSEINFKPKASGPVFLQVDCISKCKADVHYKIISE